MDLQSDWQEVQSQDSDLGHVVHESLSLLPALLCHLSKSSTLLIAGVIYINVWSLFF